MANIQSNVKRNLQSKERNIIVHSQISTMKTYIKKAQKSKDVKDLNKAYSYIDSALSKGIIKQNKADRLKSRLAAFVNDSNRSVNSTAKKATKKASGAKKATSKKTTTTKKAASTKKTATKKSTTTKKATTTKTKA